MIGDAFRVRRQEHVNIDFGILNGIFPICFMIAWFDEYLLNDTKLKRFLDFSFRILTVKCFGIEHQAAKVEKGQDNAKSFQN